MPAVSGCSTTYHLCDKSPILGVKLKGEWHGVRRSEEDAGTAAGGHKKGAKVAGLHLEGHIGTAVWQRYPYCVF